MRAAILYMLGALLSSHHALAFDEEGFRTGMSEAEALRMLSGFGQYGEIRSSSQLGHFYSTNPPSLFRAIYICDGKLVTYQHAVPGGWHAFMRTLDKISRDLNAGRYSLSSSETQYGPSNTLSFEWHLDGGETQLLAYGLTGDAPANVLQVWRSPNTCKA